MQQINTIEVSDKELSDAIHFGKTEIHGDLPKCKLNYGREVFLEHNGTKIKMQVFRVVEKAAALGKGSVSFRKVR